MICRILTALFGLFGFATAPVDAFTHSEDSTALFQDAEPFSLPLVFKQGKRYTYMITLEDAAAAKAKESEEGETRNSLTKGALAFRYTFEVGKENEEKDRFLRLDIERMVTNKETGKPQAQELFSDLRAIVGRKGQFKELKRLAKDDPNADMISTFVECITGCGIHRELTADESYRLNAYKDAVVLKFESERKRQEMQVAHFKLHEPKEKNQEQPKVGVASYRMNNGWLEHLRFRFEMKGMSPRLLTIERVPNAQN